jgi:predicted nucleic-acid-binding Zn-ribbon protein
VMTCTRWQYIEISQSSTSGLENVFDFLSG